MRIIKIGSVELTEKEALKYIEEGRTIFVMYSQVRRLNPDLSNTLLKKGCPGMTHRGRFHAFTEDYGKSFYA